MDRREFLKKFVALSSTSLIISSCAEPKQSEVVDKKNVKKVLSSDSKNQVKPKLPATIDGSKIHPNSSNLQKEEPILQPTPTPPEKSLPRAVYGPPPVH